MDVGAALGTYLRARMPLCNKFFFLLYILSPQYQATCSLLPLALSSMALNSSILLATISIRCNLQVP